MSGKLKIIIFGAREGAKLVKGKLDEIGIPQEIIAFCDNDKKLQNKTLLDKPIITPNDISSLDYDQIIISTQRNSYIESIIKQLVEECNVPKEKINRKFVFSLERWKARLIALNNVSQLIIENKIDGEIAELGVFQGDFALNINEVFPQKKLYLFDTFEGFSEIDIKKDFEIGNTDRIIDQRHDFSNTTENYVLNRMKYPENCIIKKGYFPQTAEGLEEKYAFVSLDADLYQPMYEGLKYFYPRLENGGYIFIHDFFSDDFIGTKKAVLDYSNNLKKLHYVPLGDNCSIGIMKNRHFA